MKDIKNIIAKNLSELRQSHSMTQLELAEKLNYSDKAISKWERGESLPDISVLVEIAELFGVSVDYLTKEEHKELAPTDQKQKSKYNRKPIAYIAESCALIVATIAFTITTLILGEMSFQFLYFIYAMPIALIVKLVFNSIWFNPKHNYYIISLLMWSILAAVHITFLYFEKNVALIYLLGAIGQVIIVMWSFIGKPKK